MKKILGLRLGEEGKIFYYPCEEFNCELGDFVIVLTKRGVEYGVVKVKREVEDDIIENKDEERIIRKATTKDLGEIQKNKQLEKKYHELCKQKINENGIKIKLVRTEYLFDKSKLIFYFVADGRVDFRSFVKELAYIFKTRIELRQIGVRDEARMMGGLGICGKPFCCSTFLTDFQSVSVKMAKDQNMALSPTKISGVCGRLMCCLKYEEDVYLDCQSKDLP